MNNKFLAPLSMEPAKTGSVVENVIQEIRYAISNGRFGMGDKLPTEFELMEELQVSRNSLREAMKILSTMGIVEIRRGDGTYICSEVKPNIMDFIVYSMLLEESKPEDVIELRQTLDEDVLRLAMRKCSQEHLERLQEYINEMRRLFAKGEISQAARIDYEFHIYLAECAQNKFLSRIVTGVYGIFEGSIEKTIRTEEEFASADKHHQDIVNCLITKDVDRVPFVVSQSLQSWRNQLARTN